MLKQQILRIFLLGPTFALASCVTVNLGGGKITTADGVSYSKPTSPFQEIKLKDADHAWQNRDNGNTISYLSTCNDPADPTLESARGEYLGGLTNLKIVDEKETEFNGRGALTTTAEGNVDGVRTRLQLVIFKKNNCLYTLSYVAVAKQFNQGAEQFQNFTESFKAP